MTTLHLRPDQDEIAVVLVRPGEFATVETERGPERLRGMDTADVYPEVQLALVPHTPAAVGWGGTHLVTHGVGPGLARTPSGLRASVLQRILRGHKLDEPVWAEARRLIGSGARAVYVRQQTVPYFSRTRLAAVAARPAEEAS